MKTSNPFDKIIRFIDNFILFIDENIPFIDEIILEQVDISKYKVNISRYSKNIFGFLTFICIATILVINNLNLRERGVTLMGKRAENKVLLTVWIDKDLKEQFREAVKGNMSRVLTDFIIEYVKEHSEETGAD